MLVKLGKNYINLDKVLRIEIGDPDSDGEVSVTFYWKSGAGHEQLYVSVETLEGFQHTLDAIGQPTILLTNPAKGKP